MAIYDYSMQVALLLRVLPLIAQESAFALKGGTAINLFYQDMPRLSVDIDLAYLPVEDRAVSLVAIDAALDRIARRVEQRIPGARAERVSGGGNLETRMLVRSNGVVIKIETSPVQRGTVFPPEERPVVGAVEEAYGFVEMPVLAFEDLYAGKLVAALDRQHPRDLFDVHMLYQHGGITDALFDTFLVYLVSSSRPMHEVLAPGVVDLEATYRSEFEGMTREVVGLRALTEVRTRLVRDLRARLDDRALGFLLSVHDCAPEFGLLHLPAAQGLPAVQWKLRNLERLKRADPEKHRAQRESILELRDRAG